MPTIITPIGGESYNPHEKDFVDMVNQIIELEVKKPSVHKPRRVKRIRRVVPRARNKIMRMEQLRSVQNRKLKFQEHQLMHVKRIGKEVIMEIKKGEETHRQTLEKQDVLRKEM